MENILAHLRAAITKLKRNPQLLAKKKNEDDARKKENIFIIHGHDEAKWREIKDIVKNTFQLNPIVLSEQPNMGCTHVLDKFEYYAKTCSYAIAVFTPDDLVIKGKDSYPQARPNVIFELGWFVARLGRKGVMLLLKEGTSIHSDFDGVIQVRFSQNVSEKISEIQKDLSEFGILT